MELLFECSTVLKVTERSQNPIYYSFNMTKFAEVSESNALV